MINEIDESAATPLQAVKLLAMYLASPANKVISFLNFPNSDWLFVEFVVEDLNLGTFNVDVALRLGKRDMNWGGFEI